MKKLILLLVSLLTLSTCSDVATTTTDTTSPTVTDKTLTLDDGTDASSEVDVSWNEATDETTAQENIEYPVYYSAANNIATVANAEANGTVGTDYQAALTSTTVSGLDNNTQYYFNVIAKDEAGNKVAYTMSDHTTACFLPETLIMMANGKSKRIDEVVVGERVISYSENGTPAVSTVAKVLRHTVRGYLKITTRQGTIRVTANHPFFAGELGFVAIGTLARGNLLYHVDADARLLPTEIESIEISHDVVTVYNLHLEDGPPTYFANGLAVHNK